ncbi:PAS domain-containing sensor histidine kinase [Telluribacter sp. SYSU D00476]|uniref:PAS domain-containing sensor histidine kinase n=1 Tax=Telluribacter sp. SYSU D00476 TaxID=2811430 RepID=UPI001FF36469|nr:PAS domain-containing sensor histidine kinase [Telluribacter sp. SYSU D00476]
METTNIHTLGLLENASETLSLLLEGSNAGVWKWDVLTGQEWWSKRLYEMLGYEDQEIEASNENFLTILLHPDDQSITSQALNNHIHHHQPYKHPVRLKHKDGGYRWFETTGQAQFNPAGEPVYMVGTVINIDQQVQSLEELERSKQLLEETQTLARVGGWEYYLDRHELFWTSTMYDIFGLPQGQPVQVEDIAGYFTEASQQTIQEQLVNAIAEEAPFDLELQLITAQKNKIWVRLTGKPISTTGGKVAGLRGVLQDIHTQKLREIQFTDSLHTITRQNNRLLDFAFIVSHNLRSHAGNLEMMLEVMKISNSEDERNRILSFIEHISAELNQTIGQLNEVIYVQQDITQDKQSLDVADYIQLTREALQDDLQSHQVQIVEGQLECNTIVTNPAFLQSILLSLVLNAIKYRHPDRTPTVRISTSLEDNRPVLTVTDNGVGIDQSKFETDLFSRYETIHAHPAARGISQYLTRGQVEALGVSIDVQAVSASGSTYKITF